MIVVVWLAASVYNALTAEGGAVQLTGPDDYLRLVRVTGLFGTGAWYNDVIARLDAPAGTAMHWTRPLDVLLLAGAVLLTPLAGFDRGLLLAGVAMSPLLLALAIPAVIWAAAPLLRAEARPWAAIALLFQGIVFTYGGPGKVDHHSLQILLAILATGQTMRLLCDSHRTRLAVAAGATAGLGIWVSPEFMLVPGTSLAALGVAWVARPAGFATASQRYLGGCLAVTAIGLLLERTPGEWFDADSDSLSIIHLTIFALVTAGWWGLNRATVFLSRPATRLAAGGLTALGLGGLILALFPGFYLGPLAALPPDLVVWHANIAELQPLAPWTATDDFILFAGGPVAALLAAPVMMWRARHTGRTAALLYLAAALIVFTGLGFVHLRSMVWTVAPTVLLLAIVFDALWRRAERLRPMPARVAAKAATAFLPVMTLIVSAVLAGPDDGSEPAGAACNLPATATTLGPPALVLTDTDAGPEILYRTRHSVVGGNYHRAPGGIVDTIAFFDTLEDRTARDIVARRGVDFVMVCRERQNALVTDNRQALYHRLAAGRAVPDWLAAVPVDSQTDTGARVYRVIGP